MEEKEYPKISSGVFVPVHQLEIKTEEEK